MLKSHKTQILPVVCQSDYGAIIFEAALVVLYPSMHHTSNCTINIV